MKRKGAAKGLPASPPIGIVPSASPPAMVRAVLLTLLVLAAATADAQTGGEKSIEVTRLSDSERVRVDGRLDEPVWSRSPVADGFRQSEPRPGDPISERTEVRVLFDDDALYVGVWAYVRDPATLVRRMVRRDGFGDITDRVFVEIGSPADGRTAFSFGVNLAGARQDVVIADDRDDGDATWDAVWDSAVRPLTGAEGEGYAVEIRIPFSQLRYDPTNGRPWEINFQRDIAATGERAYWAPILPDTDGYVSQFGTLHGLDGLRAPRRAELVPYAATRLTRAPGNAADPFYDANAVVPQVGLDARVGLTAGLTLTATVNPDFGQVEADPAVVNLSQFEVSYDERRPFFVEGTDVFAFGRTRGRTSASRPRFFYSRRIGGAPSAFRALYADAAYAWLDSPEQTTIAAATKLSGQAGGWTLGLLDAVTTGEEARFFTPDGDRASLPVAPLTNYFVGRARRSWRGGRTVAGGFLSSVLRDTREAAFRPVLASSATVGGLDVEAATADRAWTVSAVAAGSWVHGEAPVIQALQTAPQRYYNRVDVGHLSVDPDATSLQGYRTEVALAKTGGDPHWRGSLTLGATSPGFETNDLGFQERADLLSADWEIRYNEPSPASPLLTYATVFAYGAQGLNYGGESILQNVSLGSFVRFTNLWGAQLIGTFRPTYLNDRLTWGGPIAERPSDTSVSAWVGSNGARRLSASIEVAARAELPHEYGNVGHEWTTLVMPRLWYRPTDAIALSFEPDWTRAFNTDQYIRYDEANAAGTGDVFADVWIESLDLGLRADWAFTSDLTLQLFAEPSVTAVEFGGLRELARPASYDFLPAEGEVEGFARLALRGNAVLRWEWRPGSTVYAVWQQVRDEYGGFRDRTAFGEVGDVFRGDATNVFLVKATYWFGL